LDRIRNFSIIAHIDHGKTSLSDRIMQECGVIHARKDANLLLDSMDIEKERGITIKASAVTMEFKAKDGQTYTLNLIDTPGHVDFSYEVSRALAGCEGALLVVDAAQGVQAQTVANLYKAMELNLCVIPVVNKIDLPNLDVDRVLTQIDEELGLDITKAMKVSAKDGTGVKDLLEMVVQEIPPPKDLSDSLRALIFDCHYDSYRGAVIYTRMFGGSLRAGDTIRICTTGKLFKVEEVGVFQLGLKPKNELRSGDVGYIIANIKSVAETPIGDTIFAADDDSPQPLAGFVLVKPVVFSSIYPVSSDDYEELGVALGKLQLNDASLQFSKESSRALGSGYRCGFLGLLHAEITQERLEREFDLDLFVTAPSVQYRITLKDGQVVLIDNPAHFPDPATIKMAEEPMIRASMIMPEQYLGSVMKLCMERRALNPTHAYVGSGRLELKVELPLAEVVYDFYDNLKSLTRGYGSFDYDIIGFQQSELVKLEIKVNGEPVDALAILLHKERAPYRARAICEVLVEEIPRHQFAIAVQGFIGGKVIARETVRAVRKDVTAKCYGGDVSRKRKLLEKQKEGKKRMKTFGAVSIPQKAFFAVLKREND
jgi:GTP-binding protein LepA